MSEKYIMQLTLSFFQRISFQILPSNKFRPEWCFHLSFIFIPYFLRTYVTPRKIFDTCHTTSIVVVHRTVIIIMRLCHIHKLHFDAQCTQFHHIHMYMLTTINTYALTPTVTSVVYIRTDMQYMEP